MDYKDDIVRGERDVGNDITKVITYKIIRFRNLLTPSSGNN